MSTASGSDADGDFHEHQIPATDVETTSASWIVQTGLMIATMTEVARIRVERAGLNGGRCLITNTPKRSDVVYGHVVPRSFSKNDSQMTSLEWHWGLRRLELNLDTRDNIMKLEIGHRRRYDAGRWTLLPAKKYVDIYWNTLRRVDGRYKTTREAFPIIPRGNNFQYTFFPLLPGEPITRYLIAAEEGYIWTSADFETHLPPRYATFPTITSHIHPRFVIIQIGLILAEYATLAIDMVRDAEHGELISRILQIYGAWTAPIQTPDFRWDTFQPSQPAQPDRQDPNDDDNEEETNFGRRMLKRRTILKRKRPQPVSPTQDPKKGQRSRNRSSGDSIGLSIRTLAEHERQVKKHRWDNDALREWESEIPLYC